VKILTADIYWASLDTKLQVLRHMDLGARFDLARELMAQNFTIDEACQLDQEMEPQDVMLVRLNNGLVWVPAANQPNIPTMPGDDMPGQKAYDAAHPPAGSIMVSIDAADYPRFGGELPTVIVKPSVGESFLTVKGEIFLPGPGLNQNLIAEGQTIAQKGRLYLAHVDWTQRVPIYFTLAAILPMVVVDDSPTSANVRT
jgi:hypothetical protein